MKKQVFKKNLLHSVVSSFAPAIFTMAIIGLILFGLRQTAEANRVEGLRILEEAVMRAAVHSYAINGYFPQSLSCIVDRYGIYIDGSRFIVHYEVIAENLLPYIRVLDRMAP